MARFMIVSTDFRDLITQGSHVTRHVLHSNLIKTHYYCTLNSVSQAEQV